jgi:hypothetical protein
MAVKDGFEFIGLDSYFVNNKGIVQKVKSVRLKCHCGNEFLLRYSRFTKNQYKSCGCLKLINSFNGEVLPNNQALFNLIYKDYKGNAKRRGHEFLINKSDLFELIMQNCFYCGEKHSNFRSNSHSNIKYNGVDRIDSNIGYVKSNLIPCCKKCNVAKNTMSYFEFISHIEKIYLKIIQNKTIQNEPNYSRIKQAN